MANTINAIEMVRRIREQHWELLKGMTHAERLAFFRERAEQMNAKAALLNGQHAYVTVDGEVKHEGTESDYEVKMIQTFEQAQTTEPSPELVEIARHYLEIVDSGDETRQGIERTQAHEALMDAMQAEKIPFNARWEARWIARWLVSGTSVSEGKSTTIMFAQVPARYDTTEYDPIRDGVLELTSFPFRTEDDERQHSSRYVPVLVTIEPLHDYEGATYERNT